MIDEYCRRLLLDKVSKLPDCATSWVQINSLLNTRVYYFFSPSSIRYLDTRMHYSDSGTPLYVGSWRSIPGYPWGNALHAANVVNLELEGSVYLDKGSYLVFLALENLKVQLNSLQRLHFGAEGSNIDVHWSSFPPWKLRDGIPPETASEICIGCLDVNSTSSKVRIQIENKSVQMNRNITFHYLCFQPVSPDDAFYLNVKPYGWKIPESARAVPTQMECQIYKDLFN